MNFNTFEVGDCRQILGTLPEKVFQCCVTSPPYWGLRDYGTGTWEGGDAGCDHIERRKTPHATLGRPNRTAHMTYPICSRCGARRVDLQLGLEATPEEYVAKMVGVFSEVRRLLRDDGVLWCNIGDSYAAGGKGGGGKFMAERADAAWQKRSKLNGWRSAPPGLKPKDLVGVPWMLAFALRADGWYLRSDTIWAKLNPMPESVTDRPTKAHEYVFLLSKRADYFYDGDAVKERASGTAHARGKGVHPKAVGAQVGTKANESYSAAVTELVEERNCRSWWPIASEAYGGAHFATMPTKLVTRCILSGSRAGDAVIDPFLGSGTVGMVAESLGRRWFGCELNPEYGRLIAKRTAQRGLVFR